MNISTSGYENSPTINFNIGKEVVVLLIGYNRPEKITERILELSKMNLSHLIISIDGGVESHSSEMKNAIRDAEVAFSPKTKVTICHHKVNYGLAKHVTTAIENAFNLADYVIVVEDDLVLSPNFYENMMNGFQIQLLNRMRGTVGGFSPFIQKKTIKKHNFWRQTIYFSCWGWGCNKEIWTNYVLDLGEVDIKNVLSKSSVFNKLNAWQQYLWMKRFQKIQANPFHTWDIQFQYMCFAENFVNLLPVSRFVDNTGFSDPRAVHTKGEKPKWFKYGGVDKRIMGGIISPLVSKFFEKFIDANTIAGDSKIIKWKNAFNNRKR